MQLLKRFPWKVVALQQSKGQILCEAGITGYGNQNVWISIVDQAVEGSIGGQ